MNVLRVNVKMNELHRTGSRDERADNWALTSCSLVRYEAMRLGRMVGLVRGVDRAGKCVIPGCADRRVALCD